MAKIKGLLISAALSFTIASFINANVAIMTVFGFPTENPAYLQFIQNLSLKIQH